MDKIKDLLILLDSKYSKPLSLIQILEQKYEFVCDEYENTDNTDDSNDYVVLNNDAGTNSNYINQLIDHIGDLENMIDVSDPIHLKILEEYKSQLRKISEKKLESGDKVADGICKSIKRTILKLFHVKDYGKKIKSYLRENGFQLYSFEKGHKLSDDDLCLLDENLLPAYKERTDSMEENYTVIDMVQPIIKLSYAEEDEDETCSHVLPGICKYFVKEV